MNPKRKHLHKIAVCFIVIAAILVANECYYLASLQFKCTNKIRRGVPLNAYELLSAYQMHTSLWMFGWVVDANTAPACFNKQFHLESTAIRFPIKDDDTVRAAKAKLLSGKSKRVRLLWRKYNTRASIYMNGGYISIHRDSSGEYFKYEILMDFSPGMVHVMGVPISQTVLDYLERVHILSIYTETRYQKIT